MRALPYLRYNKSTKQFIELTTIWPTILWLLSICGNVISDLIWIQMNSGPCHYETLSSKMDVWLFSLNTFWVQSTPVFPNHIYLKIQFPTGHYYFHTLEQILSFVNILKPWAAYTFIGCKIHAKFVSTLVSKRNANLICPFSMVPLGHWP